MTRRTPGARARELDVGCPLGAEPCRYTARKFTIPRFRRSPPIPAPVHAYELFNPRSDAGDKSARLPRWPVPSPGVWICPGVPETRHQPVTAAVLQSHDQALAAGWSAAWVWDPVRVQANPTGFLTLRAGAVSAPSGPTPPCATQPLWSYMRELAAPGEASGTAAPLSCS
jgi:hypothetical protein